MQKPLLDVSLVERFLRTRFRALADVVSLDGGEWSQAFSFESDAGPLVVRFGEFLDDFEKDSVAGCWQQAGLPVPEVLEVGAAFDGVFAVSRRAEGTPLEDLNRVEVQQALPSLLDGLAGMRAVELAGTGFGRWQADGTAPYDSWREWLSAVAGLVAGSRLHGWRGRMAEVPGAEARFETACCAGSDV